MTKKFRYLGRTPQWRFSSNWLNFLLKPRFALQHYYQTNNRKNTFRDNTLFVGALSRGFTVCEHRNFEKEGQPTPEYEHHTYSSLFLMLLSWLSNT